MKYDIPLMPSSGVVAPAVAAPAPRKKKTVQIAIDPQAAQLVKAENELSSLPHEQRLAKSILNYMDGGEGSIERLAFDRDPNTTGELQNLWISKVRGLPDAILKRISLQDHLVAAIVNTRANHMAIFGRPRRDRHGFGYAFVPVPGIEEKMTQAERASFQDEMDRASKRLETCGETEGWDKSQQMNFSQYLFMSTKNAVVLSRVATEAVGSFDPSSGRKIFHSFRPIDASTIYRAVPNSHLASSIREKAKSLIEKLLREKKEPEPEGSFDYKDAAYYQVIEGNVRQVFTEKECLAYTFHPTVDVEFMGYPSTPLDSVIAAVTTHLNITTHNKLYFQSGRAARGILVIKSDDMEDSVINAIRQQFNASINAVQNSWRVPVLGVGAQEDIEWHATDSSARDMEFQYLSDMTSRVILSAFQMSPEELPGYAHLSRGTNNQALSESNQEYLLTAHRDVGLRPLVASWQDYINSHLLPLIAPNLVGRCEVHLLGLEAETAEKESIRLAQDAPIHMTYNEVLSKVEKEEIPRELGGDFPFNAQIQAIMDKYLTVGTILEKFFGVEGASKQPQWAYVRDQYWMQWQQQLMQQQQMQQQAQAQQQQQAQGGGGQPAPQQGGGGGEQSGQGDAVQQEHDQAAAQAADDIGKGAEQAAGLLKAEGALSASQRKILAQHQHIVDRFSNYWEQDSKGALAEIIRAIEEHDEEQQ